MNSNLYSGQILCDQYIIREKIGEGGGGFVYRAFDRNLQSDVVVKQIKGGIPSGIERRTEVDILKNLKHERLPKVLNFFEYAGEFFTVMDFIPGENLSQSLRRQGRYLQKDVLHWAVAISDVMAYLHSQTPPVIHSDIKPGNLILDPRTGNITLIDFNISLIFRRNQPDATWISGGYSPPEQYRNIEDYMNYVDWTYRQQTRTYSSGHYAPGQSGGMYYGPTRVFDRYTLPVVANTIGRGVDTRSDVYSFGATMYHLLTGYRPDVDFKAIIPINRFNIELYPSFAAIISKCMSLDPSDRYRDGVALNNALKNIYELDEEYIAYKKGCFRRKLISGILIGAGALMLTGGFFLNRNITDSRYNELIAEIRADIEQGQYDGVSGLIDEAREIDSARIDSYVEEAMLFYKTGDYDRSIEIAQKAIGNSTIGGSDEKKSRADLYYVMGDAYLEKEDYANASSALESAIDLYDGNNLYYRDYAISLAKAQYLDKAEEVLSKAIEANLNEDSVTYCEAEIAFAKRELDEADAKFHTVLNESDDLELVTRSTLMLSRCYRERGDIDARIAFLDEQIGKADRSIQMRLIRELADSWVMKAHVDSDQAPDCYTHALEQYRKLYDNGSRTVTLLENISACCQNSGRIDEALEKADEMINLYPENYLGYVRKAFVLAEIENRKDPAERNYREFEEVFNRARELSENSGDETSEDMANLIETYNSVVEGGWLS